MKTLNEAIKRARQLSKKSMNCQYPETAFVVYSVDEEDIPGNNYHVCYEYGLDTFYQGCEVLYCSEEDY